MFVWEDESLETGRLLAFQGDRERDAWEHAPVLKTAGDAMLEEIVHGQGVVVVADARTDPRTDKQMVEKLGNRTIINVPLRLLDKPFGALGCGTFGEEGCRPPSPEEVDYLVQIAAHLSIAAGRIRLGMEQQARALERLELERRLAQKQHEDSGRGVPPRAIGTREFVLSSTRASAKIEVTQPAPEADGTWACQLCATGFSRSPPPTVRGQDSLQALKLAIEVVEAWLSSLPEYKARELLHVDGTVYSQ
jgi:hypothetical protein